MAIETLTRLANIPWSGYIPQQPTAKQLAFLALTSQEAFYGGSAGGGKALSLDTPLPTPTGWINMGDVQVGDYLIDDRGLPCCIISKSGILLGQKVYAVHFGDGSVIRCSEDHRWLTFTVAERSALARHTDKFRENRRRTRPLRGSGKRPDLALRNKLQHPKVLSPPLGMVRTTKDIAVSVVCGDRTNHSIPLAGVLQLPDAKLPVEPYILGLWLGDGTTSGGGMTTSDQEIVDAMDWAGFQPHKISGPYHYGTRGLTTALRRTGILGDKHIPIVYLRASESQRRALLMGLMDTDGTCDEDGGSEFTTTLLGMAIQVLELVRSLGIRATMQTGRATLYGRDCGPKYRIKFTTSAPVFRLSRKAHRQPRHERGVQRWHWIQRVEELGTEPMQCVTVDSPSHLYLASRSMIPTHNSSALLMAALQYVDVPGYAAILFRRTYTDLALPGALMDRAAEWLGGTGVRWHGTDKTWRFPSGATLSFGYLETENDKYRYQGAEFQFCGFDETTAFTESQYRYLFSRLRRLEGSAIPLRMRAASNPGGIGHDWVKMRFIDSREPGRVFLPATLADNPHLDREEYIKSLNQLDPITRQQLLDGDWTARQGGSLFRREWFGTPLDVLPKCVRTVRYWDLAATEQEEGTDPDWTVGLRLELGFDNRLYISDVGRLRGTPQRVEARIAQTAALDGKNVIIWIEQEPGASGVNTVDHYVRRVLPGYTVRGNRATGSKVERARPVSSYAEAGNIRLINGPWVSAFLDETDAFPNGSHDDAVDALTGAFSKLLRTGRDAETHNLLNLPRDPLANPLGLDMTKSKYRDRDREGKR